MAEVFALCNPMYEFDNGGLHSLWTTEEKAREAHGKLSVYEQKHYNFVAKITLDCEWSGDGFSQLLKD